MIEFYLEDVLPPLMFLGLVVFLASGYPAAFAIAGVAMVFAGVGIATEMFELSLLSAMPDRLFGIMSNYVLLAVPFFVFMGTLLERSRLAEDLLQTIGELFGSLRGGLALAVVLVGTLLGAAVGVVGASVIAMGLISLPVMLRYGYNPALATGVIAASGTLGAIIPPSVVMVVLADQMGVSVGDLFVGSLVPGLMLAGLIGLTVAAIALVFPEAAPALPAEARTLRGVALLTRTLKVMIPPLLLIVVVLGSIVAGVATPTEAGALGAVVALVLAGAAGRLTLSMVREVSVETMRLSAMVMFLLVGSTAFALVFRGVEGDLWLGDFLALLPGGAMGLVAFAVSLVFALGFFIDLFEIAFIIVPLLLPACREHGVDLVWFGVVLGMILQTSFLTPPFGMALFYLRGVTPGHVPTTAIYCGVVPFIVVQVLATLLVIAFPSLVTRV